MRIAAKTSLLFAVGPLFTDSGLAAAVDLTSGTSGTTQFNQSFDTETRGIDVTVLGGSDLVVTSMTLSTLETSANPTTVGARIYTSAGVLLASATTVYGRDALSLRRSLCNEQNEASHED